jgi:hypothetical protein
MAIGAGAFAAAGAAGVVGLPSYEKVYVAQAVVYDGSAVTGNFQTYPNGDHSNAHGGTAPAYAYQKKSIETPEGIEGWYTASSNPGYDGSEAKFRTHCNYSHIAYDDPILFPGQPGKSHLHMFFGNTGTNAYSTFESLRTSGQGTCMGGILNRTAYWFPAVIKPDAIGDGKDMVVKPDNMVVYYSIGNADVDKGTAIPNGFNYITGIDPADATGSRFSAEVAASINGAFALLPRNDWSGFIGWHCEGTDGGGGTPVAGYSFGYQPYLKNDDGTATLDCAAGTRIYATINAAACWDGVNLTSPDGRSHVRRFVQRSGIITHCPVGWYRLPALAITFWFSHNGMSDYKNWYLSSDRFNGATFKNGQTFHMDWFGAWDPSFFKAWQLMCTGVFMPGETSEHSTCGDSLTGDARKLRVANPVPSLHLNDQASTDKSFVVDTGGRWTDRGNAQFLPLPGN